MTTESNNVLEQADHLLCSLGELFASLCENSQNNAENAAEINALSDLVIADKNREITDLKMALQKTEADLRHVRSIFASELKKVEIVGLKHESDAHKAQGELTKWKAAFNGDSPARARDRLKRLQAANDKLQKDKEAQRAEIIKLYDLDQNMRKKLQQAGSLSLYADPAKKIHVFLHHTALNLTGTSGQITRDAIALQYWHGAAGRLVFMDPHDNELNVETKQITEIDKDAENFMRGWLDTYYVSEFKKRNAKTKR